MGQACLHIVSGKGGVGKSTFAASLALRLAREGQGPVLLVDIQGSGRALKLLGATTVGYDTRPILGSPNIWGACIEPRATFMEYFSIILALGGQGSAFSQFTQGLRDRVVEKVFENRVVLAFVDACPGLEPAVLLGKVHWEAQEGRTPDRTQPWKHVVVDAPATGHGLMLFKSTFALIDVFRAGLIFQQARSIKEFVQDPVRCKIHLLSLPEEVPLRELIDMQQDLNKLNLSAARIWINKAPPQLPPSTTQPEDAIPESIPTEWRKDLKLCLENWQEQHRMLDSLNTTFSPRMIQRIPYFPDTDSISGINKIASLINLGDL